MQFQLTVLCLNVRRFTLGTRDFYSAMIAREPMTPAERSTNRGYLVQQVTTAAEVFEQTAGLDRPETLSFICTLVEVPGGAVQPHLLSVSRSG